jgi:hypothetical protein
VSYYRRIPVLQNFDENLVAFFAYSGEYLVADPGGPVNEIFFVYNLYTFIFSDQHVKRVLKSLLYKKFLKIEKLFSYGLFL